MDEITTNCNSKHASGAPSEYGTAHSDWSSLHNCSGAPSLHGTASTQHDYFDSSSAACPAGKQHHRPNARDMFRVPKVSGACSSQAYSRDILRTKQENATEHDENKVPLLSSIPSFSTNFRHALYGRVCSFNIHPYCTLGITAVQTRGLSRRPPGLPLSFNAENSYFV
jgi:hypothetical protein